MEGETHATAICVLDLVCRVDGDDDRTTRLPSRWLSFALWTDDRFDLDGFCLDWTRFLSITLKKAARFLDGNGRLFVCAYRFSTAAPTIFKTSGRLSFSFPFARASSVPCASASGM